MEQGMRTRRLRYGLGSLLILTTACAFASQWLRKPVIRAAIEPVGVVATGEATDSESEELVSLVARYRMVNAGPDTLWYTGYNRNSPLFSRELEQNGVWAAARGRWCGTGASSQALKPGDEVVFDVDIPERTTAMKVGLWVSTSDPARISPGSDAPDNEVQLWSKPLSIPLTVSKSQ
jgi:hypothetical protein